MFWHKIFLSLLWWKSVSTSFQINVLYEEMLKCSQPHHKVIKNNDWFVFFMAQQMAPFWEGFLPLCRGCSQFILSTSWWDLYRLPIFSIVLSGFFFFFFHIFHYVYPHSQVCVCTHLDICIEVLYREGAEIFLANPLLKMQLNDQILEFIL